MAELQRPSQPSPSAPPTDIVEPPRKDGRWVTLTAVLGAMVLVTVLRVWPLTSLTGRIDGIKTVDGLARDHSTAAVIYSQTPPVGGVHDPAWQNCGIYAQPIRNENAVHALEHGAVWITYRSELSIRDIEQLSTLARGRPYVLLSPYPGLPVPIAASAWGVQITTDSPSDVRLARFIARYVQGSQAPEPGAACTGGVGIPIGP